MPVDDLWYRKQRGPDGERLKSKRHGKGKRWRCRYVDASGKTHTRFFDRKVDAEAFDVAVRSGQAPESTLNQSERHTSFHEYAERWRRSRQITQALEYQRHLESRLKHHHYPYFGDRSIRSITVTDVLEWISKLLEKEAAQTSVRTYFDVLNLILNSAVADRVIPDNPCRNIRISAVLRGLSRAPKWVPTSEQVLSLLDVVPDRYLAAIWLGAGEGMRLGEVLAVEDGPRCVDPERGEVHVVQQLRFHSKAYGGFYLAPPKSGSVGDVDLDDHVAEVVARHVKTYPPVTVMLADITQGTPDPGRKPLRRPVALLFTDEHGRPIHNQAWSKMWAGWRKAAGWPEEGTFHSLRHHFATALITAGADPTEVQRALRHSSLRITLETYVHWWPKKQRRRNVVSSAIGALRRDWPSGQTG